MILRGAQIHRDEYGQCGLLLNPTLSSNNTGWRQLCVLTNTRMSLCDSGVSHHHFKPGNTHGSGSKGWDTISCDSIRMSRGAVPLSSELCCSFFLRTALIRQPSGYVAWRREGVRRKDSRDSHASR
jgi:hypothetical protein